MYTERNIIRLLQLAAAAAAVVAATIAAAAAAAAVCMRRQQGVELDRDIIFCVFAKP